MPALPFNTNGHADCASFAIALDAIDLRWTYVIPDKVLHHGFPPCRGPDPRRDGQELLPTPAGRHSPFEALVKKAVQFRRCCFELRNLGALPLRPKVNAREVGTSGFHTQ